MAINTAKKRRAVSGIPVLAAGVTPNASKDQDWRFSAGLSFIGYVYGIDNAEARRAVSGMYPFLAVGVTPNAVHNMEWRAQAGWGYMLFNVLGVATLSDSAAHGASVSDSAVYEAVAEVSP